MRRIPTILLMVAALLLGACTTGIDEQGTQQDASPTVERTSPPAGTATDGDSRVDTGSFEAIPEIVREVAPSVVSLEVQAERQGRTVRGAGSGVIWNQDGAIVTNNHVIEGASEITVFLADGERVSAEVVATDPRTDLAVIQADRTGLPAAEFADRLPEVGELAVALGNPLGLQNSATAGIVSGIDRSVPARGGSVLAGLIQTDAPISPGNSGGALIDAERQVIGINVAKAQAAQGAENLGFAIPSTTVVPVVEQLIEEGEVSHPYLGIRGATLTPQVAERFGIDLDRGVVVADVEPGGPAAEAGIEPGSVIVSLAGEDIANFGDLVSVLRQHDPGGTVSLTVVRGGEERTVDVTLGELPEQQ